ncbi:uncharacterized protein LOC128742425 [Sabethes cyaneus]|uniref:uncharacterized protein LOC128742425 n=1 Tax=Sabethes cyaneus TaxID=53552 RepID=UPI00237D7622|nr:uncharacterized protein LOC128742425 [Sabethes cyaneus]
MDEIDEQLAEEMKTKRICRFCLTQEEPMSDIFSSDTKESSNNNSKTKPTPLTLQIMACVSIEVYKDDGMPSTICNNCRQLMDHSYRFKQICKKADTLLKTYPLTGVWPEKLAVPFNLFKTQSTQSVVAKEKPQARQITVIPPRGDSQIKRSTSTFKAPAAVSKQITVLEVAQVKPPLKQVPSQFEEAVTQNVEETKPVIENVDIKPKIVKLSIEDLRNIKQGKPIDKAKSLNATVAPTPVKKPPVKLINGNLGTSNKKPVLLNSMQPSKKTEEHVVQVADGRLEIISMEASDTIDPLKLAEPVETNVFPCTECDRSFPLRQLLEIHKSNHNRERNHPCELCDKRFFNKYDLAKHNMTHTGERPFVCVICKSSFPRATLLTRHQRIHKDQAKFICMYCNRSFFSDEELQKHSEIHQKRRPYHCSKCPKSFAYKQGLERHEVTHDTNLPYPCEHCDVTFTSAAKLARHLTAHAGNRPYPCRLCPKSYMLPHHLTRHMRTHQAGKGVYKCSDCSKSFNSADDLIYHSAVHATASLNCPLCRDHFKSVDLVTAHIKLHSESEQHACDYCDLLFLDAERLEEHCHEDHQDVLATDRTGTDLDTSASGTEDNALVEGAEQLIIEKIVIGKDGSKTITTFVDGEQKAEKVVLKSEKTSKGKHATNDRTVKDEIFFDSEELAEEEYVDFSENDMQVEDQEYCYEEETATEPVPEQPKQEQKKSNVVEQYRPKAERKSVSPQKTIAIKSEPVISSVKPSVQRKMDSFFKKTPSKSRPSSENTANKSVGDVLKNLPKEMTVKRPTPATPKESTQSAKPSKTPEGSLRVFPSSSKVGNKTIPLAHKAPTATVRSPTKQQNSTAKVEKRSPDNVTAKAGVKRPAEDSQPHSPVKRVAIENRRLSVAAVNTPMSAAKQEPKPSPGLKRSKTFEMKIGDKMVKVQKVIMTKSEVAAMARDGKIEMQGETMILKK